VLRPLLRGLLQRRPEHVDGRRPGDDGAGLARDGVLAHPEGEHRIFAAVCALFDLLEQVANNQRGLVRSILIGILRTVWTTATYVVMPAMVLEGQGFFASFKRSKALMENDPTQVGIGVVGLGLVTWLLSFVCFGLANFVGFQLSARVHPVAGLVVSLFLVNVSWALGAYLKSTYYTCYYLWARECERNHQASVALAPEPLRNVMGDVQPGMGAW
jgi:hypothetical protein